MGEDIKTVGPAPARVPPSPWFLSGTALVVGLALFKLGVHLYADRFYGYFRDELYFIACSNHLAAGYVDQPPLIALIVRFERLLFGDSLQSIRLLPAVAGAITVLLAGWIARELGGGRYAQGIAALATLMATSSFSFNHYVSMNAFEPLFWMGCAVIVLRIIRTGNQKLWLWFGLLAGLGLENKHSMAFFGFGICVGLLLSEHRSMLARKWFWMAGGIALLLFLPNLIWNVQHHWPFLELMRNIRASSRNAALTPLQYIAQQFLYTLPTNGPLWIAGLGWLLCSRAGRPYRLLGTAYVTILICMLVMGGRAYYLLPGYPMLFAAGGVAFEGWFSRLHFRWLKPGYAVLVAITGAIAAPMAIPVLPPPAFIRFMEVMHTQPPRIETGRMGPLPQFYADMFGWEEMTQTVAQAYNALPPDQRGTTAILASNYGEAGAIDFFGPKYGLPKAICPHQSYWYWGPRQYTGASVIAVGVSRSELQTMFRDVEPAGTVDHPYSMPSEHFQIYYCRGIQEPLGELWPRLKKWR